MSAQFRSESPFHGEHRPDARVEHLRVPPHSVEAEQAVLGGLMLAPGALSSVSDLLTPDDFYRRDHQLIFRAIVELAGKDQPYDAVTLGEWFESMGQSEQVAGGAYLVELATTTPSAANIRAYASIVADKATLRALIETSTGIVADGFDPRGRDAGELVAESAARLSQLTLRGARDGGLKMIRGGLAEAYHEIEAQFDGSAGTGLAMPWGNARRVIAGLEDTDFMVVAARPGMGKTVVGLEIADYAAVLGRNVAIFSLEMSRTQLLKRMLSRRARVDQTLMRQKGALSDDDWAAIVQARRELQELPIAIDDTVSLTIEGLTGRANRMHAKVPGGLGLIVVDYLQLMQGDGRRDEKRQDEVAKISRGLKHLAKMLKAPVVALSQLNRSLETRTDKRPMMADLRESGAIEQDADIVAFLYRDDYYTKDECNAPGVSEFIVSKYRNGATGTAYLRHHLEYSAFDDYHGPKPVYSKGKGRNAPADGFDDDVPASGRARAAGPDR